MRTANSDGQRPTFMIELEAARYLTISRPTLRRWRVARTGPKCFKVGDIIRYTVADLNEFIAGHTQRVA